MPPVNGPGLIEKTISWFRDEEVVEKPAKKGVSVIEGKKNLDSVTTGRPSGKSLQERNITLSELDSGFSQLQALEAVRDCTTTDQLDRLEHEFTHQSGLDGYNLNARLQAIEERRTFLDSKRL